MSGWGGKKQFLSPVGIGSFFARCCKGKCGWLVFILLLILVLKDGRKDSRKSRLLYTKPPPSLRKRRNKRKKIEDPADPENSKEGEEKVWSLGKINLSGV